MLLLLCFRKVRTFGGFFWMLGAFSVLVVAGLMLNVRVIDGMNTTKHAAHVIGRMDAPRPVVVNYGCFDETLPFYLGRRTLIASYTGELEMGSRYEDAKHAFLSEDEFIRLFRSDAPVVAVLKEKRLAWLRGRGVEWADIMRRDDRCLIANRALGPFPRDR
jgi:hypothetical protein